MKTEKILVGTIDEIVNCCVEKSKCIQETFSTTENSEARSLLYSKEGFIQQIKFYSNKQDDPIKMGMLFYLGKDPNSTDEEMNVELKSIYYRIKDLKEEKEWIDKLGKNII